MTIKIRDYVIELPGWWQQDRDRLSEWIIEQYPDLDGDPAVWLALADLYNQWYDREPSA